MNIIELTDEHKSLFAACLEDWSADVKEAGTRRAEWIDRFLSKGFRAQLAIDENGTVGGMIQYLPIEHSFARGSELYFVPCIWVHGHKQGRGNFQGRGMGSALLEAAEADARTRGAKGMAAWGIWLPFWMKASWFKRHGYRKADRQSVAVLLWKRFCDDAVPPCWYPKGNKLPDPAPGKVNVTAFVNGWCTVGNLIAERARRAAVEIGDKVVFHEIDTSQPGAVARWGYSDALFVDKKEISAGPPPSYDKIRSIIAKRARSL
ncbi:MAG: GNAT family N-acetyltransferase [Pseudomonadota bacterium]